MCEDACVLIGKPQSESLELINVILEARPRGSNSAIDFFSGGIMRMVRNTAPLEWGRDLCFPLAESVIVVGDLSNDSLDIR